MPIIGITGKIGSGKTTASNYIKSEYKFKEYAFADPIKQIALVMGFEHKEVYGSQKEKEKINTQWNISGRTFMQKFGTEIGRDILPSVIPEMDLGIHNSVWVRVFENKMRKYDKSPNLVIGDVRFLNEAQSIRKFDGIIVHIHRKSEQQSSHTSETEMSKIVPDFVVDNNGTREDLFRQLDCIIRLK